MKLSPLQDARLEGIFFVLGQTEEPKMPAINTAATVTAIVPYLDQLASAIETHVQATPDTKAAVAVALDGVKQGITALAASDNAASSMDLMGRIEEDAQAILGVAAGLPLPFPYSMILLVVSSLMPAIISGVNMLHRSGLAPKAST